MSRAEERLRDRVLAAYVSSSPGPHRPVDAAAAERWVRAYRHHLRGAWLPRPRDGQDGWLDLACGQGSLMRLARGLGFGRVVGVDVSEEMLAPCRAAGLDVVAEDVLAFLERAPDSAWQVVSAFDLLEHLGRDDGFRLLAEVRRVLAPGGVCLLKLPNAASPFGFYVTASDLTHEAAYSPLSLAQLASLAGFRGCAVREVGPAPLGPLSIARWLLWRPLRACYGLAYRIETGAAHGGVYSQVMLARLER